MMRKVFSVASMAALACAFGFVREARATVTIDVLWGATGSGGTTLSISPGDSAGGGTRTMIVRMTSATRLVAASVSVSYQTDDGLAVSSAIRWGGLKISKGIFFQPIGTLNDTGSALQSFNATVGPPNAPPSQAPGTYQIGTIVWNTSGTNQGTEVIAAYIDGILDAFGNGAGTDISGSVTLNDATLNIVPEPSTALLLGLGVVGLVLAGRRRPQPPKP